MRNSSRKPQPPLWSGIIDALNHALHVPVESVSGGLRPRGSWLAGGLLCVLVVGCVSLVGVLLRRSVNPKAPAEIANAPADGVGSTTAIAAEKSAKRAVPKRKPAGSDKATQVLTVATTEGERGAAAPVTSRQIVLRPPVAPAESSAGEKENSDIGRERASWFFQQRAYPFEHIPEGALQKAIQQRDAMKAQQRLASGVQGAANPILSFPGDALWHLMGPQPINNPFGFNGGSPTASGRVTAIAVDPADTTGNTVYIGGAAGGVWKTTDGGSNWTPLTDFQPSLSIGSIAIDPNNHNTIYVGTGEENFSGDAYYGAGILKSTDGGTTWTQMGASTFAQVLGPQTGGAFIGSIAVQPGNSSIVLAAVSFFVNGTIGGIYRSTDGGATWTEDAAPQGLAATSVLFESVGVGANPPIAWAAMGDIFGQAVNGVYKSTDSGATWTLQTGTGANVLPTTNLGRITLGYAPSTSGAGATIYAAIADSSVSSNDFLGLFKTMDGGANWMKLTSTPAFCNHQCWYDMAVGVHPTNPSVIVVGGGAGPDNLTSLFESVDGGTTWTGTGSNSFTNGNAAIHPHVDTHALVFTPAGTTLRFYVGNDGGVWRTDNPVQGTVSPTWVDLNTGTASGGTAPGTGLAITQFYPGISAGISDENYGFGGTQDNDVELFNGSFAWTSESACGDGGFTAIDPQTPTTVYITCDKLAFHVVGKSVFNGEVLAGPSNTFNPADTGISTSDRMQFIPPLAIAEKSPTTLYFGTCRLYQTNDGAATWTAITGDLSAGNVATTCPAVGGNPTITTMDVAHQSPSIVLAGTSNGKVWESLTATAGPASTWTEIDNGALPPRHVTAVRTLRSDSTGNVAYATFSGFGACAGCGATPGHVFVTTNATSGAPTWTNISGDLPDIPVNDLIVDHSGNPPFDALYIGTDVGVFSCPSPSLTLCANWTVVGDGLPNSPVLGLAQRRSSRILRAATHGRSMWQIQLTDENPGPVAFLSSLTPAAAHVGDPATQVTVSGGNFSTNTKVIFTDKNSVTTTITPTFVSTTQLTISVNSSLLTDGQVFLVSLADPQGADTGGGPFAVMNPVLGPPTLTNPSTTAGAPYKMHFTGSHFVNGTTVTLTTFGNFPLTGGTASSNGTVFDLPVPASFLTTAMTVSGTITNPVPGGGPTPGFSINFTINPGTIIFNPNPISLTTFLGTTSPVTNIAVVNTSASPATITAQSIAGTNAANFSFAPPTFGTTCNFPSTGQSGTGSITLAANGTCNFGITYTAATPPGNAVSNATLSVTDNASGSPQTAPIQGTPIPATLGISPVNFGPVGIGTTSPTMNATLFNLSGVTLNVNATGFTISGTNAADFQFVPAASPNPCPSLASFSLPTGLSCDVGLVFTPSIAGNEAASISVSDDGAGSPQSAPLIGVGIEITSISPPIVATGGPAFTLTVNGGGFAPSAVVSVNGSARLTTFISSNELLASIPASDIAAAGTLAITVTSPNPGGTTSEPKTLFIAQAPPANNDNINFALGHRAGATTFRTASGPFTGGGNPVTLIWSSPFANTNYTAICTTEVIPGIFSLPTVTARAATTITVVPAPGGTPSGIVACMAIPDSDASTVRKARVPFSSAANVTVTWSPAFGGTAYVTACTVESASAATFTSVISTFTAASIVVDNSAYASGTMHCIGIPKDGTYTSNVRSLKTPISGSPQGVAVTFGAPFNTFTNDNTDYVAACSDVAPGVASSTAALAILAGSKNVNGFTVINEIPSGTLHCIAVPLGGSANSRFTEDTTQATAQLAAITSPATLATPVDPTPACAPGGTALQGRAKSVWEVYIASENGTVVADTRFSSYPTILSAWTISTALPSSTATFTPLACASGNVPAAGSSPAQSSIRFNVTQGTTYYFMVSDATSTGAGGILTFNIDAGDVAPPNDDNATPFTVTPAQLPYNDTVNSVLATANTNTHNDPVPPCASGAASSGQANSVWYTFTPSSSGTITASTLTSPYETILNVTSGTPNGTQVACNQTAAAGIAQSEVSFAATSGTQYFFMISSVLGDGGTTNFHLNFSASVVGTPASITATSGTPQSAAINTAFAAPLVATVKDSGGNGVSGVTVTFNAPASGASGTFAGGVNTATTNGSGVATSATFTANATAGSYTVTATVAGVAAPANFSLTNTAGTPASVTATSGTPQNATINTAFAAPLVATVKDAGNNPVSGVTVTFNAPASGASGTFAGGVKTATTNASGVATSATFTANSTAGSYTVTATVAGVASPANFSLTNNVGPAASITATSGTPQSAPISTAFVAPLVVTVKDSGGNPVSGVTVTFNAPVSGASGTFAGGANTATTNASGVATSATFTANGTAGTYTVAATVSGVAAPANFSLSNTAGTPASITATSGTPQNATINTAFAAPLVATVKDAGNNPVNGVTVTFNAPASGASGTFAGGVKTATTNASGVATSATFTANSTAGSYTVTATVAGVAAPANFSLTNNPGAAASITPTSGTPQSTVINTTFGAPLVATVKDSGGNGVSGVTVTFTAPSSGASGTFAGGVNTATTNASGVATSAAFTADATAGAYTVTATVSGVAAPANFSLTNTAGTPASVTATAGTPQGAAINTAFATQFQATVKDAGGNGVTGVLVTFTAPSSGASGTFAGGVNTATTNASGIATAAVFTANSTVGSYTVTATVSGVAAPANFSLTNNAGPAATITATSGTPQSATIGTAFAAPLVATVKDAGNNPVAGVVVTFTAPSNGASGTFASGVNTATTNASGVATSAVFTANSTAGSYTVTAKVPGVAAGANFSLTNTAGSAAAIVVTSGGSQSAAVNTAFAPLTATVKDSGGNGVPGVTVTFTAPSSGASGTFAGGVNTAVTDSTGLATAPTFTANSITGNYTVTATASGVAAPANFSLTNTAGPAASITATSGTPQNATINAAFAAPLVATVKDSGGNPVSGVTVTFTAPSSGASGTFAGGVKTATTNGSGVATSAVFTANSTAGSYTVTATVAGVAAPANFSLTNSPGPPASIAATSGTPQSATINTAFAAPLVATVKDSGGNPVTGVTLTFTAPASGASGTFAGGVNTATTDSSGAATSATFTANATAGAYTVTASVSGVAASANFSLTNLSGSPASITATAGAPQSAPINTAFTTQLQATVKDSGGNPVSGAVVTFTAPSSGASGTFAGGVNTTTTNASGIATAAVFTANGTVGAYTVTASVAGVAAPANFSLSNTAGPPASITATSGTPQNATINTPFAAPLVATVKDSGGNLVSGVTVTFIAPSSGASGTFAGGANTATTNASGVATSAALTANATAGSYTVTATVSGVAAPANFSLTNKPGPPASIAATAGTPQAATIGSAFATQLQATVKDAGGNLVSGVVVTFAAPASGASGTFAGGVNTATTNASGVATAAVFTANSTAGAYTVTASVAGVAAPANFSLTNNNPVPAITPPLSPASVTAGSAAFTLTITGTNFVTGATVTFGSNPALTPTSITSTQIVVTIPAADFATGGTPNVTVVNPGPGGGASNAVAFTVNNPVPTVTSASAAGKNHSPGGAAFTLTVNGTNFVSTSVVNFIVGAGTPKAETTTFVSATQLTAAIPAGDVTSAGVASITVTNPNPGGGTTTANTAFAVDGYTVAGPANPPSVKAGQQAMIPITVTPTANGFTNAVTFSVSGLPAHTTFVFNPASVTPNGATASTTLTVTTVAGGAMPPAAPVDPPAAPLMRLLPLLWLATLLAAVYAARLARRAPQLRRYVALLPLVLLLITGAALAGCIGGKSGTPKGQAPLTITATSGTMTQTTNVTLTVN